jgi:hypothetical protein
MQWSIEKVAKFLLIAAILSGGTLSGTPNVWPQEKGGTVAQQIQGSWTLVSLYVDQDGKKIEPMGSKPRGSMILTPDGRFSIILMRESLPKFASNNRAKGTAEENQAIVRGSLATFGRYTMASDKAHTVNLHYEGSTFPNWDGQDLQRSMVVIGDEMEMTVPKAPIGGASHLIWKRAK